MQKSFSLAEKKFKYLRNLPKYQWSIVNNKDDFKIYTHSVGPTKTVRVVKDFSSEINLDHYFASLTTLEVRTQWCCLFKNVTLFDQPNTDTSIIHATTVQDENIEFVEQTSRKKHHVQYISTSMDEHEYFMCILIENRFDHARATIYYQQDKEMAIQLLSNLLSLKSFPWISQCDKAIQIEKVSYGQDDQVLNLDYLFTEQNYNCQELPRDILDHHQSWDNHQTKIRKNKFLSSSSLLFSSSPNLNTKIMSSYPEKHNFLSITSSSSSSDNDDNDNEQHTTLTDELSIEFDQIPELSISLPNNDSWSKKFAQLCVRCYKKPNKIILQILHPYNLMQYFNDDMKLDEHSMQVHLVVKVSQHQKFIVNNNEWPIRSWKYKHEEDTSYSASEDEEDDDIFVDGMENIIDPIVSESSQEIVEPVKEVFPEPSSPTPTPPPPQRQQLQVQQSQVKPQPQQQQPQTDVQLPVKKIKDDTMKHKVEIPDENKTIETAIPANDPVALQKIYPKFAEYMHPPYDPVLVQAPSKENGYVAIKKLEIPDHPMGGFLSESSWKECSIWDIKAVLESEGARKIWDNTFESASFLHPLTQTSSIWHTKLKGAWPVNPRDYVCFHGQYTSSHRIDLLSTSCIGDSFQYKPLPKESSGYIRATMDVMGWRLEQNSDPHHTVSVKQVLVTQFPTWVINFITSRFLVQTCAAVQSAKDYFETFGAPPSLESLSWALLVNLKHDHERKNWRCEYTRRTDAEKEDRKTDLVPPTTVSVIRLDKRRWAQQAHNHYSIVIDPPPSRVIALAKACDPFGIWVSVEHAEEFIIPLRGKILVLIKPDQVFNPIDDDTCQLNVNGVITPIEEEPISILEPLPPTPTTITATPKAFTSEPEVKLGHVSTTSRDIKKEVLTEEEQVNQALDALVISPKKQAQAALSFLKQTDEVFGWTMITENNKSGLKVFKKSGLKPNAIPESETATLIVPEPYMTYKATKVIENFSVDEVTCVVTDIGNLRKTYDDTIENISLVRSIEPGCRVLQQTIKALFPFKNREVYVSSCLAQEIPSLASSNKRTMYIESSIPDFPTVNSKKMRGTLYMSGWILEAIDPYTTTTNHPIPSTRVTYVTALDLGASVPSYISNLVASNWAPKKIQSIESYLKSKGPPPFLSQPQPSFVFANNTLSIDEEQDEIKWVMIQSSYDKEKHHYKVTNRVQFNRKSVPIVEHIPLTTSTSSSTSSTTYSSSSSMVPLLRPGKHTLATSDLVGSRRGSLPVNTFAKKRTSPSVTHESKLPPLRSITMLQSTLDLRAFPKGYEIQAQLYDVSDPLRKRNISSKLILSISEPLLSHLIDDSKKKPRKHTIQIQANIVPLTSIALYELEFSLIPAREESIQNKPIQLTVSDILAEDAQNKYNGIILVNGEETKAGIDTPLKSLQDETDAESMHEDKPSGSPVSEKLEQSVSSIIHEDTNEETAEYIGGGVVATALGNVSAGVNQLSARMMSPFRSQAFSASTNEVEERYKTEDQLSEVPSSGDEDEYHSRYFSKEEKYKINASSTLHEIRLLRRSSDTMRKGMLLLIICLSLAVVIALLLVQPMLERYYASFNAASTITSLDQSVELGLVHRLIQIPWFGGWNIQLIAIKRQNV